MSKNSIPVIKFLFKEELKVLSDALKILPGFEVQECGNSDELSNYLTTVPAGLIITSLQDRNDLIQIATFIKIGKKIAKDTATKIVVFNFTKDRNIEKAISKLGIQDLIEPGINTKALKFKMDFWMKSLNAQVKKNESSNQQKVKNLEQAKINEKKQAMAAAQEITWNEPLDLEDDIWILKKDNDCKRVLSKWLIRLLGPSPYIGQWNDVKSGLWCFDIHESEKEMFVPNEGSWFFSGDQKPDFVWKENIWLISGENFELYFKNKSNIYSRLKCENRNISISKNSLYAKTKEEIIIESFNRDLVFKRQAVKLSDMEGESSTDELNNNLSGKNKTDEINGDPLKGKSKSSADKSGNLSGKTKGEAAIEPEDLEQKTATSREKSHWANNNKYEEEEAKGQLSVGPEKHREGSNLEREMKDGEHKKHYKNHNEAEDYDAAELGKNLHGKSSTDELESHYGRSSKGQNSSEAKEREGSTEETSRQKKDREKSQENEKKEGGLSGKSSTDKLDSHYGRSSKEKNSSEAKEREGSTKESSTHGKEREREKAQRNENKDGDFAGNSPLDKLEAYYKNSLKEKSSSESRERERTEKESTDERKERELSGKSSTDKLDSHYGKSSKEKSSPESKDREGSKEESTIREEKERAKKDESKERAPSGKLSTEKSEREGKDRTKDADVVSLNRAREEKEKLVLEEEKELEALTRDAKVISFLTHQGKKIECGLNDFFDQTIIFQTNDGEIKTSEIVKLDMLFKFQEKDNQLKMDGNVITVDEDGEGSHYVTIQLSEENASAFDTFMKLYESRQKNVNEFLKKVKGL